MTFAAANPDHMDATKQVSAVAVTWHNRLCTASEMDMLTQPASVSVAETVQATAAGHGNAGQPGDAGCTAAGQERLHWRQEAPPPHPQGLSPGIYTSGAKLESIFCTRLGGKSVFDPHSDICCDVALCIQQLCLICSLPQEREQDETEQQFTLQRFVPLLADVVEDLAAGKLPESEYVSVSAPRTDVKAGKSTPRRFLPFCRAAPVFWPEIRSRFWLGLHNTMILLIVQ